MTDPSLSTPAAGEATLPGGVTVGRHTYGHDWSTFQIFIGAARIEVGAFCSIAPEVRILAGSEHITSRATTFPLKAALFDRAEGNAGDVLDKGTTVIGNDVWLGLRATILSGVLVGDGAVVGAGAVVSKSVPPYAIVAGNPARIIRYRFEPSIRRRLLALGWWDWDDEEIGALKALFVSDVESFLDVAERTHATVAESDLAQQLRRAPGELITPHQTQAAQEGTERPPAQPLASAQRISELEAQIAGMRSTTAWRWATRYWRLRSQLRHPRAG
jgi:acetyltransferase-like isoleucine patch superfamily enzyme